MNTFIALFRGINVGGHHILPMKELVQMLEELNYQHVSYYIQSGNVVFRQAEKSKSMLTEQMSMAILQRFGFQPKILLFEKNEFQDIIRKNPFNTAVGKALHFYFLESKPEKPNIEKLTALQSSTEEFELVNNVFYLYAPDGIGRSKLAAAVEQNLGVPATARNWNTVEKLLGMADNIST